jgi:hypothetical protein
MRGGAPNTIITCCLVFIIGLCIASAVWLAYSAGAGDRASVELPLEQQGWTSLVSASHMTFPVPGVGVAALLVVNLVWTIIFKFQYKKIGATELFFFVLFFAALSFEAFRIASLSFYLFRVPPFIHTIITRIVYFGRFAAILFLLFASLYACEFRYQKFIHFAGVVLVVALTLSYLISLDPTDFLSTYLFKLNDELGIFLINLSLGLFSIINFIIASVRRNGRFGYVTFACILFIACREVVYFSTNPLLIGAAIACFALGAIIVYREIDRIYLFT